ncbi:MAG: putative photosynthetic complex assembly protein PuhE [Burkholderiaceae bacterium]
MSFLWPFLFTVFAWWFSTGVILYLDGLPAKTFKWTFAGATIVCVAGLVGLAVSASRTTVGSAYCAFSCALLVWAWQEVAFLLGYVTGPRRIACDASVTGWKRAALAFQTVQHHELALLVLAFAVLAVTWGQPNQVGWWTFATLWAMRQSAKLNVFLGVRNLGENFLPSHLNYLQTYFLRKPMNPLLPVSLAGATLVVIPIWKNANSTGSAFEVAAFALVGSLLSLAILEHLLLVLPLPSEALWKWGMRSHRATSLPAP